MTGIQLVVIILVPVLYQVVMLQIKQNKRHKELLEILHRIEDAIKMQEKSAV